MLKLWLAVVMVSFSLTAFSSSAEEEFLYDAFQSSFYNGSEAILLIPKNERLYVDALWDSLHLNKDDQNLKALNSLTTLNFPLAEKLRLGILKLKFHEQESLDPDLVLELENTLLTLAPEIKIIYVLAAHEKLLIKHGHQKIINLARLHPSYADVAEAGETDSDIEADQVSDLYFNTPDSTTYMGGEYIKSVKLYLFCQQNRLFPCLLLMRDVNGFPVRNDDNSIWYHWSLASAVTGLPSYERNGNTPAGIFTIDSVMPQADQQISYGQFRRMMLNFIPKSNDEALLKSLLPKSSWNSDWWKQTAVARDIGRNLFRIHGTGRKDNISGTPYFPFSRTHGCISNKENNYEGITYKDQRILLDRVMKSMELAPVFSNEPKIKGILYLMELSDRNRPLRIEDLEEFGIK